jgi:hypothetical protein
MMTNMRTPELDWPVGSEHRGSRVPVFGQRLHDYGDDRRPILDFIGWWLREAISLTNLLTRTAAGAGAHTSNALQSGGAASGAGLGLPLAGRKEWHRGHLADDAIPLRGSYAQLSSAVVRGC